MKLTPNQIDLELKEVPDWKLNSNGQIEKTFVCTGFPQAMMFVQSIGLLAEHKNHHPDILILWNQVRLSMNTHDVGGISNKDFELAKLINALPLI